jgi:hypothetical protein
MSSRPSSTAIALWRKVTHRRGNQENNRALKQGDEGMTESENQEPSATDLAKDSVRAFIQQAVSMAVTNDVPLSELRGVALFNPMRDAKFTSLETYDAATQSVEDIPKLADRFGPGTGPRMVLQFVYQYFPRVDGVRYDETIFDGLWGDFLVEVEEPNWTFRAVGNLRNFAS